MENKDNLLIIYPLKINGNKLPPTSTNKGDDLGQFICIQKIKEGSTPIKFFSD